MNTRPLLVVVALLGAGAFAISGAAHAQSSRTIRFEAEELVGKVRKPDIQILVSRQNLSEPYQLELKESFIPKIIESVERKPF